MNPSCRRSAPALVLAACWLAAAAAARPLGEAPAPQPPQGPVAAPKATGANATAVGVSPRRPVIVLFGDSLTEFASHPGGFHLLLTDKYARKADVINRGYAGYNTRWAQFAVPEISEQFAPGRVELATVWFGANDADDPSKNLGFLSVPLKEYSANLKAIADGLRAQGIHRLVFIGPPPVDESKPRWSGGARTNKGAAAYVAAAAAVAREAGAPFVDLFNGLQANKNWRSEYMAEDGGHLGPKGHQWLADAVLAAIQSSYPCVAPEALPLHFPDFMKIDVKDPASTFSAMYGAGGAGGALAKALAAC